MSVWLSIYSFLKSTLPKFLVTYSKGFEFAIFNSFSPSLALINSPLLFNNFNAFQFLGLWLAVIIIPASAFSKGTAISTVGVVDRPKQTTFTPIFVSVSITKSSTIFPEILASLPTTILLLIMIFSFSSHKTNDLVYRIMSSLVKSSPFLFPIVPLIPEIDFISGIIIVFCKYTFNYTSVKNWICKFEQKIIIETPD